MKRQEFILFTTIVLDDSLYTSHIEISRKAFRQNLKFLNKITHEKVLFSSVIKGNAYGHGIEVFVPLAVANGIRHFSVFSADEAWQAIQASPEDVTVMIMGMLEGSQLEWAIEKELEFYIFDLDRLAHTLRLARKLKKRAKVHLEVETGMNRTGFSLQDLPNIIPMLQEHGAHFSFCGLCTHYAGAESIANYYRIQKQQYIFQQFSKSLTTQQLAPKMRHTACSAAVIRYPTTQMDMVRIGILQYGFFPSQEVLVDYLSKNKTDDNPLRRLISWKSSVMDVKTVKRGEFVGYGTSYLANSDLKIAVVPVGYSQGYSRSLSNQGRVLIKGQRVNVVGMVNMNMITVDVTNVPGIAKGDEVVLIGKQGDQEISVSAFGEYSTQVNYELLTRLPAQLPRRVVD